MNIYLNGGDIPEKYKREIANTATDKAIKMMIEWIEAHCKGYHAGNHGGQFGHFGIFLSEIEALKELIK